LKRLEQEHANQIRRHTTNSFLSFFYPFLFNFSFFFKKKSNFLGGYVETPALSILRMKGFQKGKEDELLFSFFFLFFSFL